MPLTHAELRALMTSSEDEHLEFKEAKASFSQDNSKPIPGKKRPVFGPKAAIHLE